MENFAVTNIFTKSVRYYHVIPKIYRLPDYYFFKLCVIIDSFAPSAD